MYKSKDGEKVYYADITCLKQLDDVEPFVEYIRIFVNEKIHKSQIPNFITSLIFYKDYDHTLNKDSLPNSVDEIKIFNTYCHSLTMLPSNIKKIVIKDSNYPLTCDKIDYASIPDSVDELCIDILTRPVINFPDTLKKIVIKKYPFVSYFEGCKFPEKCEVIDSSKYNLGNSIGKILIDNKLNIDEKLKYSLSLGEWRINRSKS
jgi:hypothetical protein